MRGWFDRSSTTTSRTLLPIGLDFGTAHLKLVQMRGRTTADGREAAELAAAATVPTPVAAHREAAALETFFRETVGPLIERAGFVGRRVALALPAAHTFASQLRLAATASEQDVRHAVRCHAQDWLPFPAGRATIRHADAGEVYEHGQPRREVLALAIRREVVERLLAAASAANLDVVSITPEPFALLAALAADDHPVLSTAPARLLIDLGHAGSRVYAGSGRELMFARVLHASPRELAGELRRCRQYLDATFPGRPIEEVVFTGGGAGDRAFCRTLAEAIGLPARRAKPKAALAAGLSLASAESAAALTAA
jgi:Tfp pilus assembly PilM family ATPase